MCVTQASSVKGGASGGASELAVCTIGLIGEDASQEVALDGTVRAQDT